MKKDIDIVAMVQRRATKMIPTMKGLTYEERLKKLKLPTLTYRRLRGDMIEVYKIMHHIYDPEVADILKPAIYMGGRGHNFKLFHPHSRTSLRKNFFTVRVVEKWNQLPSEVVNAPSVLAFERRLDKHWSRQPMLYDWAAELMRTRHVEL